MYIPARTAITALGDELARHGTGEPPDQAAAQAAAMLVGFLDARERDPHAMFALRRSGVVALWVLIGDTLDAVLDAQGRSAAAAMVEEMGTAADAVALEALEYRGELLLGRLLAAPSVGAAEVHALAGALATAEAMLPPVIRAGADDAVEAQAPAIDREMVTHFLRARTGDSDLVVTHCQYLPGGFGKQTYLLSVAGAALEGDFILRLDHASGPLFAKDCHFIGNEFALARQLWKGGYPLPEPILSGTGASSMAGRDAMIVRRSVGHTGGAHMADGSISDQLLTDLAQLASRLHSITPPPVLDAPGTTLAPDLLVVGRSECTRRNIIGWRDYWQNSAHAPSCALVALFDLLLRIIPDDIAPPSLIHGDFGLHNCMINEGRVVTVLDWESAHIGDPAEDVAYTVRALGFGATPERFLDPYRAAGGEDVAPDRLAFYDLMAQVRSICICNLSGARFTSGARDTLKLLMAGAGFVPHFLRGIASTVSALGHPARNLS